MLTIVEIMVESNQSLFYGVFSIVASWRLKLWTKWRQDFKVVLSEYLRQVGRLEKRDLDALKTMGAIVRDFRRIGRFVKVCAHWVVNYMQVQDTTKTIFRLGLFPILVHDKPSSMVQTFYKSLGYFHSQIQIYWWLRFNQPRVPTSHIPQKSFFYFS